VSQTSNPEGKSLFIKSVSFKNYVRFLNDNDTIQWILLLSQIDRILVIPCPPSYYYDFDFDFDIEIDISSLNISIK